MYKLDLNSIHCFLRVGYKGCGSCPNWCWVGGIRTHLCLKLYVEQRAKEVRASTGSFVACSEVATGLDSICWQNRNLTLRLTAGPGPGRGGRDSRKILKSQGSVLEARLKPGSRWGPNLSACCRNVSSWAPDCRMGKTGGSPRRPRGRPTRRFRTGWIAFDRWSPWGRTNFPSTFRTSCPATTRIESTHSRCSTRCWPCSSSVPTPWTLSAPSFLWRTWKSDRPLPFSVALPFPLRSLQFCCIANLSFRILSRVKKKDKTVMRYHSVLPNFIHSSPI